MTTQTQTKRVPIVHAASDFYSKFGTVCGGELRTNRTKNFSAVTCKRCLKGLAHQTAQIA